MATLRPNSASGQLSDPDSGCFSSHSNEAPGGWLEPHFGPSMTANGGIGGVGGVPMPMLIDSSSSPLSSSSSMSHHQQPQIQIPNNKLLAHTLENRKRVLHTLIREKTDTLVWIRVETNLNHSRSARRFWPFEITQLEKYDANFDGKISTWRKSQTCSKITQETQLEKSDTYSRRWNFLLGPNSSVFVILLTTLKRRTY